MTENEEEQVREESPPISLSEFLESTPPGIAARISGLATTNYYTSGGVSGYSFAAPEIQLHCGNETCNRNLFFRRTHAPVTLPHGKWHFFYVTYLCSNCRKTEKIFSLAARLQVGEDGECFKFGETPEYGPPTPSRLISLIGPDRDLFLKGRRSENLGLGIGAFVYYRRVVENQKNRILDEIIKVAQKLNAPAETIKELEEAKGETQFSKAIGQMKASIPQTLLINGHNPLTLLHTALSDGLHARTDGDCLGLATSIRIVLGELSDRLAQALKDEAALKQALARLMTPKDKEP